MHREKDLYLEWIFLAAANPSRFLLNILKKEFHDWNFIQKTCSGQWPPVSLVYVGVMLANYWMSIIKQSGNFSTTKQRGAVQSFTTLNFLNYSAEPL